MVGSFGKKTFGGFGAAGEGHEDGWPAPFTPDPHPETDGFSADGAASGFTHEPFDEPEAIEPAPGYAPGAPEPVGSDPARSDLQAPDPHAAVPTAEQPFQADPRQNQRLDLDEGEVRLPWLEGDDDEDDDARPALGQGIVLLAAGLVAVLVLVGVLVWALHGRNEEKLVAVGGVIEAPKTPYKVKPAEPGGKVVDGTGDSSFAVAEGQSRPARIDSMNQSPDLTQPAPGPTPTAQATPKPAGVGVQVGAYANTRAAEAGWAVLKKRYDALSGYDHRIVEGTADFGTVYRLQAVAANLAAARSLCAGLQQADIPCQVKN